MPRRKRSVDDEQKDTHVKRTKSDTQEVSSSVMDPVDGFDFAKWYTRVLNSIPTQAIITSYDNRGLEGVTTPSPQRTNPEPFEIRASVDSLFVLQP